jgi:hypothetical protein
MPLRYVRLALGNRAQVQSARANGKSLHVLTFADGTTVTLEDGFVTGAIGPRARR